MENLNAKWRSFFGHLSSYIIVIGALGIINWLTSSYPWFLWPALGWGAGLAFHLLDLLLTPLKNLSQKWRDLFAHLGSYVIIISMLGIMNLLTSSYPWFLWPALGWGIGLVFHLAGVILGQERMGAEEVERERHRRHRRRFERERESGQTAEKAFPPETTGVYSDLESQPPARVNYPLMTNPHSGPQKPPQQQAKLASQIIQAHLERALAYKKQIDQLVQATRDENTHTRLQDLANQVNEWTQAIEDLARRVDSFQQNNLIRQDLEAVPKSIEDLEARLASETDPTLRTQLERTLANRQNQLASLERLQLMMKRAEIQIESTLSSLGTIYSQLLTGQSTNHVADYSRLAAEVDEEVHTLQDHLEALEEVKLSQR